MLADRRGQGSNPVGAEVINGAEGGEGGAGGGGVAVGDGGSFVGDGDFAGGGDCKLNCCLRWSNFFNLILYFKLQRVSEISIRESLLFFFSIK